MKFVVFFFQQNFTSTNPTLLCICEQKIKISALREITLMRKGGKLRGDWGSDCLIGESLWDGLMRDECIRTAEAAE